MWTWRGLPHTCATSDAIEALSNQRWYREVCTIKECPIAAQRHTELRTDRAVVPIEIDRRQAFDLQLPSLDPGLGQRQTLPCPGLAAPDHDQTVAFNAGHQQSLVGPGAIGGADSGNPLPGRWQSIDHRDDHLISGQVARRRVLQRAVALAQDPELQGLSHGGCRQGRLAPAAAADRLALHQGTQGCLEACLKACLLSPKTGSSVPNPCLTRDGGGSR